MKPQVNNALFSAVMKLLRPLVRIMLRNGIPFKVFADLTKWVYVDVAMKEFGIPGKIQTDSRVSIITGLSRKEVNRQKKIERFSDSEAINRYNRAARVISGWVNDDRFKDANGRPKSLPFDAGQVTFSDLVKSYSGDVPPRAILDELLNVDAVKRRKNNRIDLRARAYIPSDDRSALYSILGIDVAYLITTIDHNINSPDDKRIYQRKVSYDNVSVEASEKIRHLSAEKSQHFLESMDRWLSKYDRDVNPDVDGNGRKMVGIGIYYFEKDVEEKHPER